jgi:DNA-binding transcriptional regulator YiaG
MKNQWNNRRIIELRRYLQITQAEMAEKMGTRQQTISEWELGAYKPRGMSVTLLNIVAEKAGFRYGERKK